MILADPVAQALSSNSLSNMVYALSTLALAAVAYCGYAIPMPTAAPRWERYPAAGTAAVLAADAILRAPHLHDDLSASSTALPVLTGALLIAVTVDRWRTGTGQPTTEPLTWPLGAGRWQVVEGSGRLLNHHWVARAQRHAVDVVGSAPDGRSHRRALPNGLSDFEIYRTPVIAPADGTVLKVVDGLPDHPSQAAGPAGNHVVIDTGRERLVLAHLARGSVTTREGERISAGDPVGSVGSSGNSTEPHLHIHAVRDGNPVALVFKGIQGPLRRGRQVRVLP